MVSDISTEQVIEHNAWHKNYTRLLQDKKLAVETWKSSKKSGRSQSMGNIQEISRVETPCSNPSTGRKITRRSVEEMKKQIAEWKVNFSFPFILMKLEPIIKFLGLCNSSVFVWKYLMRITKCCFFYSLLSLHDYKKNMITRNNKKRESWPLKERDKKSRYPHRSSITLEMEFSVLVSIWADKPWNLSDYFILKL